MAFDPNGPPPRIEVVTAVQRRRRFSTAEKVRLVEESMQPGMSVSLVAGQAGIAPSMLFNWRRRMLEGGFRRTSRWSARPMSVTWKSGSESWNAFLAKRPARWRPSKRPLR